MFNRHYAMTLPQKLAAIIAALITGFLAPLWLAVGFAQDAIKLDLRQRLGEITRDQLVMNEMRAHLHASLEQLSPQIGMSTVNLPESRVEEELRFSTRPSNASILSTASAYSDALFRVMIRDGGLLPHFVSWASVPSFLAADIRMHATGQPKQVYDLSPGREALLDILTEGLAAKAGALQFTIRVIFLLTVLVITTALFSWLALSAYTDIRVHWPSRI